jgi:hypothetical protein
MVESMRTNPFSVTRYQKKANYIRFRPYQVITASTADSRKLDRRKALVGFGLVLMIVVLLGIVAVLRH